MNCKETRTALSDRRGFGGYSGAEQNVQPPVLHRTSGQYENKLDADLLCSKERKAGKYRLEKNTKIARLSRQKRERSQAT